MVILVEGQPAGHGEAHLEDDVQRSNAQPWRALPVLELDLKNVGVEQVIGITVPPQGPQIQQQDPRSVAQMILEAGGGRNKRLLVPAQRV